MDYVYILLATAIMLLSCKIQYRISMISRSYLFYLPLLYAVLTFWIGFLALLFSFALIFIGELATCERKSDNSDVF